MPSNVPGHARELGDNVNEDELKAMIDEFDLDGDGESKPCDSHTSDDRHACCCFSQLRRVSGDAQFGLGAALNDMCQIESFLFV